MDLNGIPATGNRWLFTRRAARRRSASRASWSATPTPCATWSRTASPRTCPTRARARVNVGIDMEMAIVDPAYAHLPEAVERGDVTAEQRSTSACGGCSTAKLRLGLLDDPYVDEDRAREVLADPAHREVARVAAERSAVLLRNEGGALPLDAVGPRVGRGPRPAGRLAARHPRAVVLRLRPGRDRDGPRRHPGQGRRRRARRLRARRPAGAAQHRLDLRHVRRQPSGRPGGLRRRRGAPAGRRPGRGCRRRRRGRRRVAEHDRRAGVPLVAGAAGPPAGAAARPSSPPARRSCCS